MIREHCNKQVLRNDKQENLEALRIVQEETKKRFCGYFQDFEAVKILQEEDHGERNT